MVLEFLASAVDLSLAPTVQDYLQRYQARPERYGPPEAPRQRELQRGGTSSPALERTAANVAQPAKLDNDLYVRDYSRCILCYKCVEACGVDAQNTFAIAVAGRGFEAQISTEFAVPLPSQPVSTGGTASVSVQLAPSCRAASMRCVRRHLG